MDYSADFRNRPLATASTKSTRTTRATYTYDNNGNMLAKTDAAGTQTFPGILRT